MTRFQHECQGILHRNRFGSYATQYKRRNILMLIGADLKTLGFKDATVHKIGDRYVRRLVALWSNRGCSNATMMIYMSQLRWLADRVGRGRCLAKRNEVYGIGPRQHVATENRAQALPAEQLSKVQCPYVKLSLELQAAFGLRRQEAIMFRPAWSCSFGDHVIKLWPASTKGGRGRAIPVSDPGQRELLRRVKAFCGNGSLIPPDKNLKQQINRYSYETRRAGLMHMHSLRHQYAQDVYEKVSGLEAPVKHDRRLDTQDEKDRDLAARREVSSRLGHGPKQLKPGEINTRVEVAGVYIGARRTRPTPQRKDHG